MQAPFALHYAHPAPRPALMNRLAVRIARRIVFAVGSTFLTMGIVGALAKLGSADLPYLAAWGAGLIAVTGQWREGAGEALLGHPVVRIARRIVFALGCALLAFGMISTWYGIRQDDVIFSAGWGAGLIALTAHWRWLPGESPLTPPG
jgi:hypothetical protein